MEIVYACHLQKISILLKASVRENISIALLFWLSGTIFLHKVIRKPNPRGVLLSRDSKHIADTVQVCLWLLFFINTFLKIWWRAVTPLFSKLVPMCKDIACLLKSRLVKRKLDWCPYLADQLFFSEFFSAYLFCCSKRVYI